MPSVTELVENRFELAALVIFLSIGVISVAGIGGFDTFAGLVSVLGFAVILPLVLIFGHRWLEAEEREAVEDPVAELRERYATGEIGHDEFERRVDRLLDTEDVEGTVAEPGEPNLTDTGEPAREPE